MFHGTDLTLILDVEQGRYMFVGLTCKLNQQKQYEVV